MRVMVSGWDILTVGSKQGCEACLSFSCCRSVIFGIDDCSVSVQRYLCTDLTGDRTGVLFE